MIKSTTLCAAVSGGDSVTWLCCYDVENDRFYFEIKVVYEGIDKNSKYYLFTEAETAFRKYAKIVCS